MFLRQLVKLAAVAAVVLTSLGFARVANAEVFRLSDLTSPEVIAAIRGLDDRMSETAHGQNFPLLNGGVEYLQYSLPQSNVHASIYSCELRAEDSVCRNLHRATRHGVCLTRVADENPLDPTPVRHVCYCSTDGVEYDAVAICN